MKKKKMQGVNSTSAADMAFTLLLFFLLTTSMDTNYGLDRRLPQPPEKDKKVESATNVNKRNVLVVMINYANQIFVAGEVLTLEGLKAKAKEFIENPTNAEDLPEKVEVNIPYFGPVMITDQHLISLLCDRGTNYQVYIDVQNELAAAYNELRDEISRKQFNTAYKALDKDRMDAVIKYYPQKISEAEPKNYGDKK